MTRCAANSCVFLSRTWLCKGHQQQLLQIIEQGIQFCDELLLGMDTRNE